MSAPATPEYPSFDEHPEAWLTTKEVAVLLGVKEAVVRRMVRDGELPSTNIGGHIRIPRSEVEAEVAARASEATPGLLAVADAAGLVEQITGTKIGSLPLLMTAQQVSDFLGIPIATVYSMMRSGALPTVMVGRTRRVPSPALIRWLNDAA
jgi:excisionase family DNA binding protein